MYVHNTAPRRQHGDGSHHSQRSHAPPAVVTAGDEPHAELVAADDDMVRLTTEVSRREHAGGGPDNGPARRAG